MGKGKKIIRFFYACILCLGFSVTTSSLSAMLGFSITGYFLLTGLLAAGALICVYAPMRLCAGRFWHKSGRTELSVSGKAVWGVSGFLMAAFIIVRIFSIPAGAGAQTLQVWNVATVKEYAAAYPGPSAGRLYMLLLSAFFPADAGFTAVFSFNLLLQAAALILLYCGVYCLSGLLPAAGACLTVICLPAFANSAYTAEPQSLQLFFFSLMLWAGAQSFCLLHKKQPGKKRLFLPAVIGFLYGLAGALSLPLLGVFFLFFSCIICVRPRKTAFWGAAGLSFGALIGFIAGVFLYMWFCMLDSQAAFSPSMLLQQWFAGASGRGFDVLLRSPTLTDYWLTVPVLLLAFFVLTGADIQEKLPAEIWAAPLGFSFLLNTLTSAPMQEQGITYLCFGAFAGVGLHHVIMPPAAERSRQEEDVLAKQKSIAAAPAARETELTELVNINMEEKRPVSAPRPGEYLENPLPVPKRHVKKEMGYGFEPDRDQMYYDIPVAENDDFDVDFDIK